MVKFNLWRQQTNKQIKKKMKKLTKIALIVTGAALSVTGVIVAVKKFRGKKNTTETEIQVAEVVEEAQPAQK